MGQWQISLQVYEGTPVTSRDTPQVHCAPALGHARMLAPPVPWQRNRYLRHVVMACHLGLSDGAAQEVLVRGVFLACLSPVHQPPQKNLKKSESHPCTLSSPILPIKTRSTVATEPEPALIDSLVSSILSHFLHGEADTCMRHCM